jgi:CBS domain-containing protein
MKKEHAGASSGGEKKKKKKAVLDELMMEPIGRHLVGTSILVTEETTLAETVALMQKQHIGCVMIIDGHGKLCGIFSERDLLNRVVGHPVDLKKAAVREFMTPRPETLEAEDRIAWALNRMHIGGYRHVPIVDADGLPKGMISVKDIIDFIVEYFPEEVLNLPPDPSHETPRTDGGA